MSENKAKINWYPGHMAKTKRQLQDQIKRIDLIIELCDARLPYSSRNPELADMITRKRHLLFLNKSDLADPAMNRKWLQYYQQQGIEAHLTNASMMKGKETIGLIEKATREIVDKSLEKGRPQNRTCDDRRHSQCREKHNDQPAVRTVCHTDRRPSRGNQK